ncbi:MAG: hypothetical protein AB7H71_16835 [Alphaproteobacteria bacterium]
MREAAAERREGIATRMAALADLVAADPALLRRGRWLNTVCQLDIGADTFLLHIVGGRIAEVREGPFVTPSANFAISGEAAIWRRLLAADPPPGDHDLFAFVKRRELRLTGDLHPLMSHLLYFKGVLAHLREVAR